MDNKNSDIAVKVESSTTTGSKEVEVNVITTICQLSRQLEWRVSFCKCNSQYLSVTHTLYLIK
jgi:ribosomal 50S subunit-recycling heat shock protein